MGASLRITRGCHPAHCMQSRLSCTLEDHLFTLRQPANNTLLCRSPAFVVAAHREPPITFRPPAWSNSPCPCTLISRFSRPCTLISRLSRPCTLNFRFFCVRVRSFPSRRVKLASARCSPRNLSAATGSRTSAMDDLTHNAWATPHDVARQPRKKCAALDTRNFFIALATPCLFHHPFYFRHTYSSASPLRPTATMELKNQATDQQSLI